MKPIASLLIAAALAAPFVPTLAQEGHGSAPQPAAAAPAAKPDLNAGGTKFGATCAACHGADGNSGVPANPKLAQQLPEYIMKELQDFKAGKRVNPIMQPMAAGLSDADIRNIAYWAGSQKAKPGFAKDKELAAMGERIYRGGIADRQIAACTGCHGPTGAGVPSQYPRLSGQQAEYVEAQLKAFRDDKRKNSLPMAQVAAKLNDREIHALADYVAGLR
ncbi:MAG TPA: c-type cytochrome [Ramlibacter sp.]|nr:c-type cytochrome [Ramlibacter sp.]